MKKIQFSFIFLILCLYITGCKENSLTNASQNETIVLQLDGIIENVGGDCSAVQIRTRSLGVLDFTNSSKTKLKFTGMSDADLSSISIFYVRNDVPVNLVNLTDRDMINNTNTVEINSPRVSAEFFTRVTLKSSVCTGQIFFLTLRDLKIYSIQ